MKSEIMALEACAALVEAYGNGEESDHVDWNDMDQAHELAVKALKQKKRETRTEKR